MPPRLAVTRRDVLRVRRAALKRQRARVLKDLAPTFNVEGFDTRARSGRDPENVMEQENLEFELAEHPEIHDMDVWDEMTRQTGEGKLRKCCKRSKRKQKGGGKRIQKKKRVVSFNTSKGPVSFIARK